MKRYNKIISFVRKIFCLISFLFIFIAGSFVYSQTPLPKGAKQETIEYKAVDYGAIGYIKQKQFVENQIITFLSKETQDTIISGKYFMQAEKAYIDGIWKRNSENGITRAYGVFEVSNSDSELGLTTNGKKGRSLNIETKDIISYQGFHNNYPAVLEKQKNQTYLLTVNYFDMSGNNRSWFIDKKMIDKYGWFAIEDFIFNTKNITIKFKNGDVFVGETENTKTEDNLVSYKFKEGKFTHTTGDNDSEEMIKLPDNNYKCRILYSSRKKDNNFKEMEIIVNKSLVEKYGYWAVGDYLYNTPIVKYTYKNGDVFEGEQEHKRDTVNANSLSIKSQLTKGKLKYATGEEFEGDLSGDWFCGVPISGTLKFTDGSVKKGNWFTQYSITTKQEVNKIEKGKSPTEKREIAKSIFKENQYQEEIYIAERALDNDDYESAKNVYANALKLKPENEEYINTQIKKIDKLQIEKKKRIAELKRKNALINKYGNYWSELILNKEFTPGMTKEMVLEFTSDKCYKISKSIHSGMTIETWIFDKDKMQLEMLKESKNQEDAQTALGVMMIMGLAEGFGYNIRDQFPTLVFTNGKLTDVYQY